MSETLAYLLRAGIPAAMVNPAQILIATPDEFTPLRDPRQPTLTIFLYRIGVNPQLRNAPRRMVAKGQLRQQPLPLELCYLITAWAKDTSDEHRILGRVLQVLYDHAELGPADLQGTSWEADDNVQLVLESLPLEDHYRIWDANEIPYRLSLTYMSRVVPISSAVTVVPAPVVEAYLGGAPA